MLNVDHTAAWLDVTWSHVACLYGMVLVIVWGHYGPLGCPIQLFHAFTNQFKARSICLSLHGDILLISVILDLLTYIFLITYSF